MNRKILLTLCLLLTSPAYAGKWLDYSNGIINLDSYNTISSSVNQNPGQYCLDGEVLGPNDPRRREDALGDKKGNMPYVGTIAFGNFTVTIAEDCDLDDVEDSLEDAMDDITDFLDSDDGYMKL